MNNNYTYDLNLSKYFTAFFRCFYFLNLFYLFIYLSLLIIFKNYNLFGFYRCIITFFLNLNTIISFFIINTIHWNLGIHLLIYLWILFYLRYKAIILLLYKLKNNIFLLNFKIFKLFWFVFRYKRYWLFFIFLFLQKIIILFWNINFHLFFINILKIILVTYQWFINYGWSIWNIVLLKL